MQDKLEPGLYKFMSIRGLGFVMFNAIFNDISVECRTTRPADNSNRDKSARMLRQLGPYYCFIILFNIYMCIIIYLFKGLLLSFSENKLFIK